NIAHGIFRIFVEKNVNAVDYSNWCVGPLGLAEMPEPRASRGLPPIFRSDEPTPPEQNSLLPASACMPRPAGSGDGSRAAPLPMRTVAPATNATTRARIGSRWRS